ncbi:hypothetical protein [Ralstonia phage phiRSL1]|uniref:Uncharacterized protein n=1 Tax=Ralstonia phage phiRSL1 TaxID=1980924 RepID=B2ZY73_9CAUD|nr:hypothetical protein RSL1_ORF261 [Ralstonia phage phiRSL1]BAG41708.1 hypothetical protein [Ralstonia phage phiRSL1]
MNSTRPTCGRTPTPLMYSYQQPTGLTRQRLGAGDETRTRDILLGRQELYQLSYARRN